MSIELYLLVVLGIVCFLFLAFLFFCWIRYKLICIKEDIINEALNKRFKIMQNDHYWYPKDHPMCEIHKILFDGRYMQTMKRDYIMKLFNDYKR